MKRAGAQRISKDFMSEEASSAEKVVEAEQVHIRSGAIFGYKERKAEKKMIEVINNYKILNKFDSFSKLTKF